MLADASPAEILAPAPLALVLADARAATLLALALDTLVLAEDLERRPRTRRLSGDLSTKVLFAVGVP